MMKKEVMTKVLLQEVAKAHIFTNMVAGSVEANKGNREKADMFAMVIEILEHFVDTIVNNDSYWMEINLNKEKEDAYMEGAGFILKEFDTKEELEESIKSHFENAVREVEKMNAYTEGGVQ